AAAPRHARDDHRLVAGREGLVARMSSAVVLAVAAAALGGHFSLVVFFYNRFHALAMPRLAVKVFDRLLVVGACATALTYLLAGGTWFATWYAAIGWVAAAAVVPCWLVPKLRERVPAALLSNDTTCIDVGQRLGRAPVVGAEACWFTRFP